MKNYVCVVCVSVCVSVCVRARVFLQLLRHKDQIIINGLHVSTTVKVCVYVCA